MRTTWASTAAVLLAISMAAGPARAQAPDASACTESRQHATELQGAHKLREARFELLVCAAKSCPSAVRNDCKKRLDKVATAIPAVVFDVKDEEGDALPGAKVTMDGEVVAEHLDGKPVSLDPGSHELTFEVEGRPAVTKKLTLREGETDRRESIILKAAAPEPPATPPPAPPTVPAEPKPTASGRTTQQSIGVQVGATGVVGLTIGTMFGVMALSESISSNNNPCPSHTGCSAQGANDRSASSTFATISAVGFIAGAVFLGSGLALYFTGSPTEAPAAGLRIGPGHVSLGGSF